MDDAALTKAVPFIAAFEGFRSAPYKDVGGVWTIAYGTTYTPSGGRVCAGTSPCTEAQALAWLEADVAKLLVAIRAMVTVSLSSNETAALASFAYNLGLGALKGSFLLTFLNRGDRAGAARQFDSYVYAKGHVIPALRTRRAQERALFERPDAQPTADDLNGKSLNGAKFPL